MKSESKKLEKMAEFRAQIIAVADQMKTSNEHQIDVVNDARIHLATNGKGAWVQAYIWVDREDVKGDWRDEIENPPGIADLVEVLRRIAKDRHQRSEQTHQMIMEIIACVEGKDSWLDVQL